jgi:hypothetical protein
VRTHVRWSLADAAPKTIGVVLAAMRASGRGSTAGVTNSGFENCHAHSLA